MFRCLLGCFVVGVSLTAVGEEPASKPTDGKPTSTIVVFGDSITAAKEQPESKRWPSLLAQRLQKAAPDRRIRVVNAGVGGNTSREALARIEKDVLSHRPDVVTLEFGGNDATDDPARHVDLKEFERNMATMVAKIRKVNPQAAIVIVTFPPVIDSRHAHGAMRGGLDRYVESYRESARRFAKDRKLRLVDLDAVIRPRAEQNVLADGVHLTVEGNEAAAQAVDRVVRGAMAIH
jgi:acyl-CoA thioesterase-1